MKVKTVAHAGARCNLPESSKYNGFLQYLCSSRSLLSFRYHCSSGQRGVTSTTGVRKRRVYINGNLRCPAEVDRIIAFCVLVVWINQLVPMEMVLTMIGEQDHFRLNSVMTHHQEDRRTQHHLFVGPEGWMASTRILLQGLMHQGNGVLPH